MFNNFAKHLTSSINGKEHRHIVHLGFQKVFEEVWVPIVFAEVCLTG